MGRLKEAGFGNVAVEHGRYVCPNQEEMHDVLQRSTYFPHDENLGDANIHSLTFSLTKFARLPSYEVEIKDYMVNKADNLARRVYGDCDYWWLILLYNRMSWEELKDGVKIRLPYKTALDDFLAQERFKQKSRNSRTLVIQ